MCQIASGVVIDGGAEVWMLVPPCDAQIQRGFAALAEEETQSHHGCYCWTARQRWSLATLEKFGPKLFSPGSTEYGLIGSFLI
jgi:hypothetical protein